MTTPKLLPATTPEAVDEARRLLAEIERVDGASPVSDQAMLAATQGARELLFVTIAEEPVGVGIIGIGVIGEGELDLAVLPQHRTPEVETAALAQLLARASGDVRSWVHGDRPATDAALEAAGFGPVRSLDRMALDPDLLPRTGVPALELPTPAGFELRAFGAAGDEPGDAAAWVAANAAAFATHPEQGRITEADFAEMRREPWFDSADLILLDAGSELAGSTWVKTLREGGSVACELYAVGVRPKYAGQGLGRLLLEATLARMAEHAPRTVTLYVDGDNAAAVGLYESAGFTIDSRSRQWLRPDSGVPSVRMDT